jgi:hypothetical protein
MMEDLGAKLGTAAASGLSILGIRAGWEQPHYTVVDRLGRVEVRRYEARLTAETEIAGEEREAKERAFTILEAYLSGEHAARPQEIAMTAPVETAAAPGSLRLRLFLPSDLTLATVPAPVDARVKIGERPIETIAALRFGGAADLSTIAERAPALLGALSGSGWSPAGEPALYTYDPPWTISFLRRNEIVVPVALTSSESPSRA